MAVSITIAGDLINDQTAGIQDDDIATGVTGGNLTGLDSDFLNYLNALGLTGAEKNFAAAVEGASDADLVSISATAGEIIGKLFFSDPLGNPFDGDAVAGITTLDGEALFLWSDNNDSVVLLKTAGGDIVGAFYIEPSNAAHTEAIVQMVTFQPLLHEDATNPDDRITLPDVIRVGAQYTASVLEPVGDHIHVDDDGPTILTAFSPNPAELGNAVGQTADGDFAYDVGTDPNDTTDFNSFSFTGSVDNPQNPGLTNASMTLSSEDALGAVFDWSFDYDTDPITSGVQPGHAAGTLTIDKDDGTYSVAVTDVIDGFSFDVLHTSQLFAKAPPGNTGHPELVVSQLTPDGDPSPFFVQFSANTTTQQIPFITNANGADNQTGNAAWVNGEFFANSHIDWVSATQATNGVAGDTIQKGELLTLRFFGENILGDVDPGAPGGGTEKLDPTTDADGIAIKFDGIGNSEDLLVLLNLIDANGVETTRVINVQNSDLIKGNANVPAPYNTEFQLDNNDALLIIEGNDYKALGETYHIQGVQIMQSANGLTGNAINLNGATGVNGGSSTTTGLTAFDPTDNDVIKIVDIGFIQQTVGTIDASLQFDLVLQDGDGDLTGTQSLNVNVSNDFIVV